MPNIGARADGGRHWSFQFSALEITGKSVKTFTGVDRCTTTKCRDSRPPPVAFHKLSRGVSSEISSSREDRGVIANRGET